ncbi:MAG: PIG-L family deacetylase [Planctomycetes bacterium]|nr:PIG-L family deacetylase [Planctomycetota bacterium]
MKALFLHAHFDDYEFTAAGLFELWKRKLGKEFRGRVIICTDGKAGHQFRTRDETGLMRLREQEESARIGGYEFKPLRLCDGTIPREACLGVTIELLAAIWKEIREFEPDYLFCPPVITDALAGIHVDHVTVGEAVRKVAYMINVPHAFTPEYPADETTSALCKVPVIINVFDGYMKTSNSLDLSIDIHDVFPRVAEMAYCHQSQIVEWLPWVASPAVMAAPTSLPEWEGILRDRYAGRAAALGVDAKRPKEFYTITSWGSVPTLESIVRDFPNIAKDASRLEQLGERLRLWTLG